MSEVDQPPAQPFVRYEPADAVATLTLDSPHNRNALSRRLLGELVEGLHRAAADDDVRVVLIAATGTVFCSGADLSEAGTGSMEEGAQAIVDLQRLILTLGKPVVTIPGCPPNPYNFLASVVHFLTFGKLPEVDDKGRPKFAYGRLIHENCERRAHFEAGGTLEGWLGRHNVEVDRMKETDRIACRTWRGDED